MRENFYCRLECSLCRCLCHIWEKLGKNGRPRKTSTVFYPESSEGQWRRKNVNLIKAPWLQPGILFPEIDPNADVDF